MCAGILRINLPKKYIKIRWKEISKRQILILFPLKRGYIFHRWMTLPIWFRYWISHGLCLNMIVKLGDSAFNVVVLLPYCIRVFQSKINDLLIVFKHILIILKLIMCVHYLYQKYKCYYCIIAGKYKTFYVVLTNNLKLQLIFKGF